MGGLVYTRALHRAAEVLGGKGNLRDFLRVSMRDLEHWMAGAEKPPMDIFLKAVDIINDAPLEPSPEVQRARELRERSEALLAKAAAARERAHAVLTAILEKGIVPVPPPKPVSALAFLKRNFAPAEGGAMIEAALDAALSATGADMGNIQLARPEGLRIVAQRGFEQSFLDFSALIDESRSVCGIAMKIGRRVAIADVQADLLLAGTDVADGLAAAGVRAVQSTPLAGTSALLGMLSTHYAVPHELTAREEDVLDHIARRTAYWLDGGAI